MGPMYEIIHLQAQHHKPHSTLSLEALNAPPLTAFRQIMLFGVRGPKALSEHSLPLRLSRVGALSLLGFEFPCALGPGLFLDSGSGLGFRAGTKCMHLFGFKVSCQPIRSFSRALNSKTCSSKPLLLGPGDLYGVLRPETS